MPHSPTQPGRRLFLRYLLGGAGVSFVVSVPALLWAADKPPPRKGKRYPLKDKAAAAPPSRLLMIDPGHGGHDPGAVGRGGTYEKDITLDIGRRLAQHIAGQPRLTARMTRERDEFLPLGERVARGRAAKADLFISLHADSAPNQTARGLSAYTLSDRATDDFARQLAQQENLVDKIGGVNLAQADQEVAAILMDFSTRQARDTAQRTKVNLVRGVGREWRLLDNPLRAANFAVLRAPDVPSILIETGFLSNIQDEAILRQPMQREKIARLLARELTGILTASAG
ncbi:MAG: N-acetylmuramoyl-L-alanine amidase [Alphaproteobacteria bacterium]